jgi:tartrate-resistant acid phosphatase type 5
MVMGDWGGIPIPPWTTPAEQETAKYMDEEVAKINAKFCLALGDNFYEVSPLYLN